MNHTRDGIDLDTTEARAGSDQLATAAQVSGVDLPAPVAKIAAAVAEARRQHDAGTCHLSEWTCSYCEDDDEADREKWLAGAPR